MAVESACRASRKILEPCDVAGDLPPSARRRGWERRFGCCAALSLSVLEVKRLLLLTLEMLVDSRPLRFAGALVPVVFSFVDAGLGFPVAIATVCAIRRHQARPCYPRQELRRVTLMLVICVILNVVTLLLMGQRVAVKTDSLRDIFRASMRLYATEASYKLALDELQLDLECCGSLAYADWFAFDRQATDYDEPEERREFGERSVPFSCCRRRTMLPCAHADMGREHVKTINARGCALVLADLIFKILVVGYCVTGLILLTRVATIVLLIKIAQNMLPEICPSDCSCYESAYLTNAVNTSCSSSSEDYAYRGKVGRPRPKKAKKALKSRKFFQRPQTARKACGSASTRCSSTQSPVSSTWSSDSSASSCARLTSSPSYEPIKRAESAKIAPTAQLQHKVPPRRKP